MDTKLYETEKESMQHPIAYLSIPDKENFQSDYGVISIYFVFKDIETGKPRNYCQHSYDYSTMPQKFYLSDFYVRCQWNKKDNPVKPYGFSIQYKEMYSIDNSDILRFMAKTLDTVNKKLHDISENEGYTENFAEYFVRICKILNCKWGVVPNEKNSSYSDSTYYWYNLAEIRSYIERFVKDLNKE